MEAGRKMNSASLRKEFEAAYRDFFHRHDIVLSAPGVLTWGADISHGTSALRIKQKIPLKTFLGANLNDSGKVTFGTFSFFSSAENGFNTRDCEAVFRNEIPKISEILEEFLVAGGYSGGMEIDFISEAPRGHGFSSTGVISVLLSHLAHVLTGKISEGWEENPDFPKSPLFEAIWKFSLRIAWSISGGKSTGSNEYAVMAEGKALPRVYFTSSKRSKERSATGRQQSLSGMEDSRSGPYREGLAEFLCPEENITELPLDYGIVFSGMEYAYDEIESTRERMKRERSRLNGFIAEISQKLAARDFPESTLEHFYRADWSEGLSRTIDRTNLKILEGFDYLLKNRHDDSAVSSFIEGVKSVGLTSLSYQKENRMFFAFQHLFNKNRRFEDEEIGILPFNTGRIGGSFLFVMKKNRSRDTLEKTVTALREEGFSVSLDYASWRDGEGSDGVRLEQFVGSGRHSDYTKEGSVVFSDNTGKTYFAEYDAVIAGENEGILLDTVKRRIYVKGVKLTSKDIHSQNTTIDVLKILLENLGKEVSNTKLPVSTYSKNKNEILGKVVLPIRKLSKERFGKEIPLSCSGGITDYYLKLERDDSIRVGILRKTR
jgi:hypothetical protein